MEEWQEICDMVLTSFITKETNRQNMTKALWSLSNKNLEEAKYLLFELLSDYLVKPRTNDLFRRIQKGELGWSHPELIAVQQRFQESDNFLINPPEVEEGVLQCNRCGSHKTFSFSKQTRRADESATVFVRCANCNHSFRL